LSGAEDEAREMLGTAREIDQRKYHAEAMVVLAKVLARQSARRVEAVRLYREAVSILSDQDESFSGTVNSCAWQMYLTHTDLDEAASLAKKAWEIDESNTHVLQTLAAILVRQNNWIEAIGYLRTWVQRVDKEYLRHQWAEDLLLFQDAVQFGRNNDLAELLTTEVWRPMQLALLMHANESDMGLIHLRDGMRNAVESLVQQLRGENVSNIYPEVD
jgi:tetratricopeptide (TPR) repeat protein